MLILLNLVISASAGKMEPFIVGGNTASIEDWPFITFIEVAQFGPVTTACGGSLLSSQTVLTAAHCLDDCTNKKMLMFATTFTIYMGHSRYDEATLSRKAIDYETPKDYSPADDSVRYDIGIMFLNKPVKFSEHVKKVVLQRKFDYQLDSQLAVAGWGAFDPDDEHHISNRLKSLNIQTSGKNRCQNMYRVICTAVDDKQYAFSGDSGGPMVRADTHRQLGIVSFRDIRSGMTVFSSIPQYWKWIQKTQLNLFKKYCRKRG